MINLDDLEGFDNLEDLNKELQKRANAHNNSGLDDFDGLTPMQMGALQNLLKMKVSLRGQQFISLQQMIDKHSNSHQSYPVIHFYNTQKKNTSLGVNIAIMDEAISIILLSDELKDIHIEVDSLRKSITNFLDHVQEKYKIKTESAPEFRWRDLKLPSKVLQEGEFTQKELASRRKILGGLLKGENWGWEEVYPKSAIGKKKY